MVGLRRSRWPLPSRVYAALAIVCAVAAFVLIRAEAERAGRDVSRRVQVVVAARPIEAGETIGPYDVRLSAVLEEPPAAIASPDQAVGRTAVTPFLESEVVSATRLAAGGGPLTVSVPEGMVGMTLRFETVPAGLTRGDRIDVLVTYTAARPYTSVVAEDVFVAEVTGAGDAFGASGGGSQVFLVVPPEAARTLAQAQATGTLAMAVRGYGPLAG